MNDGNDLLGKMARPWAKWPKVGDVVSGTVVETPSQRQSRNFETGQPETWESNGDPKMEVVVILATTQRDPDVQGDDGERALVLPVGSARFRAVQLAMRNAGVRGLQPGGKLAVTYTGDGVKPKGSKLNAPKEFSAHYVPPELDIQAAIDIKDAATAPHSKQAEQDALAALGGLIR